MLYEVITGDDDQSIYAWRGANPENLAQLGKDYPALREWAEAADLPLHQTVAVCDGANDLPMMAICGLAIGFDRITSYNVCYTKLLRATTVLPSTSPNWPRRCA